MYIKSGDGRIAFWNHYRQINTTLNVNTVQVHALLVMYLSQQLTGTAFKNLIGKRQRQHWFELIIKSMSINKDWLGSLSLPRVPCRKCDQKSW